MRASMEAGVEDSEAVRHRHGARLWFVPDMPGRDRRTRRHAGVLHDAGRRGHGGAHAVGPAQCDPARGDGTLCFRSPERLGAEPAGTGASEFDQVAASVGLTENRYGIDGRNHVEPDGGVAPGHGSLMVDYIARDEFEPLFHLRPGAVHRLLALRARLRGGAGHVRADHRGPRLRKPHGGRHARALPRKRMRVLRRLRAGLPDRRAAREDRARDGHARAFGGDDLRLLRRRLLVQGRDEGRGSGAHGAVEGRQGESRP